MAHDETNKPVKYFDSQFDDEEVLYVFRRHPLVMRTGLIISLSSWLVGPLIILALTYIRPNDPPSMAAFFLAVIASIVLGSLLIIPSWITWYFSVFIVTTDRFVQITQKGLFHTKVADMNLSQIQQINYEINGLQEALIGFGTITMQTYVGEVVIHYVHHPAKTQRHILQILRDQGVTQSEAPFSRQTRMGDVSDEVES